MTFAPVRKRARPYNRAMSARTKTTKTAPAYRCTECGWTTAKWVGRCGECQTWGTVEEAAGGTRARTRAASSVQKPAQPIAEVDSRVAAYMSTGNPEFDRVLGGGLVPGAVILMAGEPGVGKSTLLLDVAATFARGTAGIAGQKGAQNRTNTPAQNTSAQNTQPPRPVLYITGEESAAQVKLRADRIGAIAETLYLTSETDLGTALAHIEQIDPALLVIDSVQTLASAEVEGSAGGVTQVREVAASVIAAAKERNMCTLLVGHVTKEGTIAGPRLLEHLVDVVCTRISACCARLRTASAPPTRWAALTCTRTASRPCWTPPACSSPVPRTRWRAPA